MTYNSRPFATGVLRRHRRKLSLNRVFVILVLTMTLLTSYRSAVAQPLSWTFGSYTATYLPSDPTSSATWLFNVSGSGTVMGFIPFSPPLFASATGVGFNGSPGSLQVDLTAKKVMWTGTVSGGVNPGPGNRTVTSAVSVAATAKFEVTGPPSTSSYVISVAGKGSGKTKCDGTLGAVGSSVSYMGGALTLYGALKSATGGGGSIIYSGDPSRPGIFDPDAYEEQPWAQNVVMTTAPGASVALGTFLVPLEGAANIECSAPPFASSSGLATFTVAIWVTSITP